MLGKDVPFHLMRSILPRQHVPTCIAMFMTRDRLDLDRNHNLLKQCFHEYQGFLKRVPTQQFKMQEDSSEISIKINLLELVLTLLAFFLLSQAGAAAAAGRPPSLEVPKTWPKTINKSQKSAFDS